MPRAMHKLRGFTLIELVIVIVLVSIVAATTTKIISLPVTGYLDTVRRTALVDAAELSLRRMQRDVRSSLPNSIRISADGKSVEILHVIDGGRYRAKLDPGLGPTAGLCSSDPDSDVLDFTLADTCFEIMGSLSNFNPLATAGQKVAIYNLEVTAASAYAGDNTSTVVNSTDARLLSFAAKQFPYSSALQRFYIIDTPITYRCDTTGGQLLRYSGYAPSAVQAAVPVATAYVQVDNLASCSFYYTPGVATRAGQLTVSITLTNAQGESVTMLRQIHVDNMS